MLFSDDVFKEIKPVLLSALDGYSVCIFAYGQTGSGKVGGGYVILLTSSQTYTMEGNEKNPGISRLAISELLQVGEWRKSTSKFSYKLSISVLELYNEQIRDLLRENPESEK